MRKIGPLALCVLVLATASSALAARDHRYVTVGCPPAHRYPVFVADSRAEVYVVRKGIETVELRGCVYGHHRSYLVGTVSGCVSNGGACGGIGHVVLAGTIVAYELFAVTPMFNEHSVLVKSLRSGKLLNGVPTGTPSKPGASYTGVGNLTALVVKGDGSVAWIVDNYELSTNVGNIDEVRYSDVYELNKSGIHLLASGTDIGPRSLALAGSTVYWTESGKPYSAVLQ